MENFSITVTRYTAHVFIIIVVVAKRSPYRLFRLESFFGIDTVRIWTGSPRLVFFSTPVGGVGQRKRVDNWFRDFVRGDNIVLVVSVQKIFFLYTDGNWKLGNWEYRPWDKTDDDPGVNPWLRTLISSEIPRSNHDAFPSPEISDGLSSLSLLWANMFGFRITSSCTCFMRFRCSSLVWSLISDSLWTSSGLSDFRLVVAPPSPRQVSARSPWPPPPLPPSNKEILDWCGATDGSGLRGKKRFLE